MAAHFCYKVALKIHDLSRQATFFRSKVGKYFTFPENISNLYQFMIFKKIEKASETSIWLDQIVKIGKSHDKRLLCKENNPLVHPDRVIHLCLIEDTDHVVLVKEIQKIIQCVRPGH